MTSSYFYAYQPLEIFLKDYFFEVNRLTGKLIS